MTLGQKHHYPVYPLKKRLGLLPTKLLPMVKRGSWIKFSLYGHWKWQFISSPLAKHCLQMHTCGSHWSPRGSKHIWSLFLVARKQRYKDELYSRSMCARVCMHVYACAHMGGEFYHSLKPISKSSLFKSRQPEYPVNPFTVQVKLIEKFFWQQLPVYKTMRSVGQEAEGTLNDSTILRFETTDLYSSPSPVTF